MPIFKFDITSENYNGYATKTEAPITGEMKKRVVKAIPLISKLLEEQIMLGIKLDNLKRYIYYGKGMIEDETDNILLLKNSHHILDDDIIRLLHCSLGLATETGELMEALKNHIFDGFPLDGPNIREELGDICWYVGIGGDTIQTSLTEILSTNIKKLSHRYPEKFTEHHAINRDLDGERAIIESNDVLGEDQ